MTNISRYLVNHLLTFSLQDGDVHSVEEAQSRFSMLAQNKKLWIQQMFLDVGAQAVHLRDTQSQDELEYYSFKSIYRCDAINTEKLFPSLLLLVCQGADQKKPDIHFFSCETVKAEKICDVIARAVSGSSTNRSKKLPDAVRLPQSGGEMIDPYEIPNPPIPHAPNPPPANPPPYPGPRANGVNGGPDVSFLRAEREVGILNHCFDDIENFMAKLQQTAEAATVLSQRKKKKKKSKKQSAEEDLLTAKARPPPEEEFIDIFQKFKYCFSLLARLKSTISNPSSEELVHHVFKPLDMMVKTTGGPGLGASVISPALTSSAVSLLQDNLNEEERQLWTSLGHNWTLPRSQLRGPVPPYTPVFSDGWKPEALRADGQVWEDPVESQHKHEALRVKQEQQQPPQPSGPPDTHVINETDGSTLPPEPERLYSCSYPFIARNSSELSVQQGETLEVIESSKRWWKCRNRFNQIGFVPFNILEPMAHIDSPVTNKPPSAPAPPPLAKTFSAVPPSPPAAPPQTPSPQRPRSLPPYSQHIPAAEDTDKVMLVNDELLQRLTNGKAHLNKPLVIPRSSDTSVPLNYTSPPEEVAEWLRGKGFSEPTVSCLGVLTGPQLFSLNKEELRAVIPDEGARVYSQLTVQKSMLEDARRATELEAVMEKQKMKVDLKLESSTL
ncbi:epidermal growth factor receptor kinase substrate 8-like protein 1 isoform X1 [Thunnus albacares]|uniref:epidermal growth factor receptor kinase substrate 8-like protein 1 isoform X1 n=2 Tax=Thunnus maccoyii TaxID=8240 RepID=UPI001C4C2703|nr:epidermal growth factor receptor kinase substrate 8-like protein 1 isoform X1 [Thunnus maccoyii]XP_042253729.1 epidermal growth factor receptor kinase substrate 8-like protein 1 isoform X1 [Thunnus maccoyii]XP_042253730.1 epidermal growth factor receptor kinase substrate 8-like protein 1 isoform X1 [Thunnus maccoyii]XP_042253731.1 epidermal growth factor receptor kinase substrate 8-like protein 1 isoform X1 [Thunnus maccoyii]XP_044192763.1 epidermal growth factor receptor kinase substrate 8-